jgi:hypothetical protein
LIVELTDSWTEAATASIGVSIYFTTKSYCKILATKTFWGTEFVYWESIDLISSNILTIPVVKPFCNTPELKR